MASAGPAAASRPANRLISEKSPYLLQHAHNPVDWYAWGEEAFERARREDKPVLLSIGYSTCHWCHVMERESFENGTTAGLMNASFVSIKVDREERPDIDAVYMEYVMASTGSGGWPMTVFLTPDKKPFYGGTYFPPQDRYGMPGFPTLLAEIASAWKERRAEILESAVSAEKFLSARSAERGGSARPTEALFAAAFERYRSSYDAAEGGFGRAPKFPRSHSLSLLLRLWKRSGSSEALEMADRTLKAMARGGMNDQLGGGFHRYSTDARWRIPHFEKMLYDQALLLRAYVEAWQATGDAEHAATARRTADYLLAEMRAPEGGFCSAQDADSEDPRKPGHSREGAYFVWTKEEIEALLPREQAMALRLYYGIEAEGNAITDPHGEFQGQNVLYRALSLEDFAKRQDMTPEKAEAFLEEARTKLLSARAKRPAPYRDDKVLADWNGLVIAALAEAGEALEEPRYIEAAASAADHVLRRMTDRQGRLLRRWRDKEAAIPGQLGDYAALAAGYLSLYEATFEPRWIEAALAAADRMIELFWDEEGKGFYQTAHDAERLVARTKEYYDGAVPSGNSLAVTALLRLAAATGSERYARCADETLTACSERLAAEPTAHPQMLIALDLAIGPTAQVVLAAGSDPRGLQALRAPLRRAFLPRKVVLRAPESGADAPAALASLLEGKAAPGASAVAYVCSGRTCSPPTSDPQRLTSLIEKGNPAS